MGKIFLTPRDHKMMEHLIRIKIALKDDLVRLGINGEKRLRTLRDAGYIQIDTFDKRGIYVTLPKERGGANINPKTAAHDAVVAREYFQLTPKEQATFRIDDGDRVNQAKGAPDAIYISNEGRKTAIEVITPNYKAAHIQAKHDFCATNKIDLKMIEMI